MADKVGPYISYLNRDFNTFKKDLYNYAKYLFGDTVNQDFSTASTAGMFLDLMAYVGDVLSFYQDYQFGELFPETVKQVSSIKRIAKMFGYKIPGPSCSSVKCKFTIEVPVDSSGLIPDPSYLITIKAGTILASNNGIKFTLVDDLKFSQYSYLGVSPVVATYNSSTGAPITFYISMVGNCVSGSKKTESIRISNEFIRFRRINLSERYINRIESISDSDGNSYYEVMSLSEDTVLEMVNNYRYDSDIIPYSMYMKNVPYRYISEYDPESAITTIIFGSGKQDLSDDDAIPDPSAYAIPLYGKTVLSRISINPNNFLDTSTLGISPYDTTLSIVYYYGGGVDHNVAPEAIQTIDTLSMERITSDVSANTLNGVISSIKVINEDKASGGNDPPSFEEIRRAIIGNFSAQSRVVTKEDVISRIYSMPSQFGRAFRVGISKAKSFPFASQIYIVTRNSGGSLAYATDTLKENIKLYLEQYRMITDSFDILDAKIINFSLKFTIVVNTAFNKDEVLSNVTNKVANYFAIENWHIGQPIIRSELNSLIYGVPGVVSVFDIYFERVEESSSDARIYSPEIYDFKVNEKAGILYAPPNGIFELRYPEYDIKGRAV